MAKHIADVANADPTDIGLLLLERIRDRATCFGDDQKRALDDVLRTPVRGELFESQPVSHFGYAGDRNEHVLEGDSGIARSKDPDGFLLDVIAQTGMKAFARRQVDTGRKALL